MQTSHPVSDILTGSWLKSYGITGSSGTWVNVTPAGASLAPGYSQTVSGNTDDNYGVMDILADPLVAGTFYAFICYQGCWKTVDYGDTWIKVSTGSGGSILDSGKNWGPAIASDGTYMLNTCGNNFVGSPEGRRTIQKSTDGGVSWTSSADVGADPYNVKISPYDTTRAIAAMHDTNHFYESLDSGATWTDHGVVNAAISNSGYVSYLHNSDTVLYVGTDSDPSYRGTKAGGIWTWTLVSDLNNAGHGHGIYQLYYDVTNAAFFHPAGGNAGNDGIFKSTNNGTNWTRVYSTTTESVIVATASTLYAMFAAPQNTGSWDPKYTTATRNPGTSWGVATIPSGMINGAKGMAVGTDGARYVILAGCLHGGIWKYIE